jgi:hypothetical protein
MARDYGYISPLLSNVAADHAKNVREGLIAPIIFLRIPVGKPSGKYAVFDKESAYKVPEVTMAGERSRANEFHVSGIMKPYATMPYGLKEFVDKADLEFMEGPFKLWEKRVTETLVNKLELAQEKRITNTVFGLSGRSATPSTKWANGAGNPYTDIKAGLDQLFYRPNVMALSEAVFDAIEYHPKLLDKLGEANMVKKVDEQALAKLFRVDKVIIAKGRADFGKRNAAKTTTITGIWRNSVVLAYTSNIWDEPCAGKTLTVKYAEADGSGYVVRTWDEADGGILGGECVQVAHDTAELVVSEDLIYSLTEVL